MQSWLWCWCVASVVGAQVCAQGWVDRTGPGGPSPRREHSMCYDPVRGYVLMVGGFNQQGVPCADVWSWDGSQWTARGSAPSLYSPGLFWHAGLSKLVLAGTTVVTIGQPGNHSWEWDGVNWVNQTSLPASVECAGYDAARQEGVVWGYSLSAGAYGASILDAQGWTFRPSLATAYVQSTSSGVPLPFDLGIAGAPGCTLLASIDDIQAMTNVLGTAVWSLAVPTLPGARFCVQAVAFEPAANALGVVLSNGGQGTLGF